MKDCNAEKYSYSCLFAAVFRPGEMPVISAFRARYWALIIRLAALEPEKVTSSKERYQDGSLMPDCYW